MGRSDSMADVTEPPDRPQGRQATVRDVAVLAGVSPRTVSNVVNDFHWVSDSTRRAVLEAIEAVGYVPNLSARGLRQGRMNAISLVIPELRNPWFTEVADAIMASAAEHGLAVVMEQLSGRDAEVEFLGSPRTTRVDGVIFAAQKLGDEDRSLLAEARRPVVLLGEYLSKSPVDQVTVADREGGRIAVEHLISRQRTRVLVVGTHPSESRGTATRRLQGVQDALAAAGLPFDPALVVSRETWSRVDGRTAIGDAIAAGVQFDSVFCFNDALALGALHGLRDAGLLVPQDVAVVGFDDVEDASYALPALTTIAPDVRTYGRTAVNWLVERMTARGCAAPPRTARIESTLVVRDST